MGVTANNNCKDVSTNTLIGPNLILDCLAHEEIKTQYEYGCKTPTGLCISIRDGSVGPVSRYGEHFNEIP